MASTFKAVDIPDPPSDPKQLPGYLRDLVAAVRSNLQEVHRALEDAEPIAKLEVLAVAPTRVQDGDEIEAAAGVVGVSAGKYVRRGGAWVFIG